MSDLTHLTSTAGQPTGSVLNPTSPRACDAAPSDWVRTHFCG